MIFSNCERRITYDNYLWNIKGLRCVLKNKIYFQIGNYSRHVKLRVKILYYRIPKSFIPYINVLIDGSSRGTQNSSSSSIIVWFWPNETTNIFGNTMDKYTNNVTYIYFNFNQICTHCAGEAAEEVKELARQAQKPEFHPEGPHCGERELSKVVLTSTHLLWHTHSQWPNQWIELKF